MSESLVQLGVVSLRLDTVLVSLASGASMLLAAPVVGQVWYAGSCALPAKVSRRETQEPCES